MTYLIAVSDSGQVSFRVDPDPLVVRAQITDLKERMRSMPLAEQIDLRVEHTLVDGMYMRKLFIPKDTILVGKIHLKDCINFVEKGDISVMTELGSKRIQAGFSIVSPAGLQKVGIAHEDTVFINVFRTDETDIQKIEAEIATEDVAMLGIKHQPVEIIMNQSELEVTL